MGRKNNDVRRFPVQYLSALARQVLTNEVENAQKRPKEMVHLYLLSTLRSVDNEQDSVIRVLEGLLKNQSFNRIQVRSIVRQIIRD